MANNIGKIHDMGYRLYKCFWIWRFNPHFERKLNMSNCKSMLSCGGYFVMNTYDFDCKNVTNFWYIIKDNFGGIKEVPSKYRGNIKKALIYFDIKLINKEYLLNNGYEVAYLAAQNYRVKSKPPTAAEFRHSILNLDSNYDLWGCIDRGTGMLAGFAINHMINDSCDYQVMKFHPKYLKQNHPSYGLIFTMNKYYLEEKGVKYVNDGAMSITGHSNIQPFLVEKFKFRRAYCHLQIVYKWWFKLAINMLYPFRKIIPILPILQILELENIRRNN